MAKQTYGPPRLGPNESMSLGPNMAGIDPEVMDLEEIMAKYKGIMGGQQHGPPESAAGGMVDPIDVNSLQGFSGATGPMPTTGRVGPPKGYGSDGKPVRADSPMSFEDLTGGGMQHPGVMQPPPSAGPAALGPAGPNSTMQSPVQMPGAALPESGGTTDMDLPAPAAEYDPSRSGMGGFGGAESMPTWTETEIAEPMAGPPSPDQKELDRRGRRAAYNEKKNARELERKNRPKGVANQAIASNIAKLMEQGMSEDDARGVVMQRIGGGMKGERQNRNLANAMMVDPQRVNFGNVVGQDTHSPFKYTSPHSQEYKQKMARYRMGERMRQRRGVIDAGGTPMAANQDPTIRKALEEMGVRKNQRDDYAEWFNNFTNSAGVAGIDSKSPRDRDRVDEDDLLDAEALEALEGEMA